MRGELNWIKDVLSASRLSPYMNKAQGDVRAAMRWYWWNIEVSAAFYASPHCLEVALRNSLHQRLTTEFKRADWWDVAMLNTSGQRIVREAQRKLTSRARSHTPDDIVAELSFGFWFSLISKAYDRALWVPCLHKALPHYRGSRGRLHDDLYAMLLFRNRVMHYEPIHHRHLEADHQTIHRLMGYISPEMVELLRSYDRAEAVLLQRPELAAGDVL